MKLKIVGQCKGGNAKQWFDLFNNHLSKYPEITQLIYICNNSSSLTAKFPIIRVYGKEKYKLGKIYSVIIYRLALKYLYRILYKLYPYDILHIQGIYYPRYTRSIIENSKEKYIINIYGSDYYQFWKNNKENSDYKRDFMHVLDNASAITCNWITTKNDFINEFPQYKKKTHFIPGGIDEHLIPKSWVKRESDSTIYLSTRALYDYNNVDMLVTAFCKAFKSDSSKKLIILSGYGSNESQKKYIMDIVKRYNMEKSVIMEFNWIDDEELMEYYKIADYNICIGNTDQLSISIIYGMIFKCVNILSPLRNYYDLKKHGYMSPYIIDSLSVESLIQTIKSMPKVDPEILDMDSKKAKGEYIFKNNFRKYVELYYSIHKAN